MDPNEALKRAREALAVVRRLETDGRNSEEYETACTELADAFEALDQWLTKGGFLPKPWSAAGLSW